MECSATFDAQEVIKIDNTEIVGWRVALGGVVGWAWVGAPSGMGRLEYLGRIQ